MPVLYNSRKLIPVQTVLVSKSYQRSQDGQHLGSIFNISVNGTLAFDRGSPTSSGTFWTQSAYPPDETYLQGDATQRLKSILRKQEAIRQLFATEGQTFEVYSDDGSAPMKCNPRIVGIRFQEGGWHTVCPYTIDLETDILYGGPFIAPSGEDQFAQMISEAGENWAVELNDAPEFAGQDSLSFKSNQTYKLTHSVNAAGKRFFDSNATLVKQAWQWAREWVQARLGLDSDRIQSSGILNLPVYYSGYNHLFSETTDEMAGTYSVVESWILSSGSAIEDFTVTSHKDNKSALTSVTVDGKIQGLETRDSYYNVVQNKYDAANAKFAQVSGIILSRAQNLTGCTLNVRPLSTQIQRFYNQGSVGYIFEFNDRPSNYVTGAIYEDIQLSDNLTTDVVAQIPILGRGPGPLLQSIQTITAPNRTISIDVVMDRQTFANIQIALQSRPSATGQSAIDIAAIIAAANPANNGYSQVYLSDASDTWNYVDGHSVITRTWLYQL